MCRQASAGPLGFVVFHMWTDNTLPCWQVSGKKEKIEATRSRELLDACLNYTGTVPHSQLHSSPYRETDSFLGLGTGMESWTPTS